MATWADEINSRITKNLEAAREKDIRFFRIDEFKRNVIRVDEFSNTCAFCNRHKVDIAEAVETIREAVEIPGNERRQFDWLISGLADHMKKEHGFYPPYYYSYLYSFFGILTGGVVGFILYKLFPEYGDTSFMASFVVGIIATYILGTKKDNRVRKNKKIM